VADVASVAGDGPFIPRDLVARLHAARAAAGVPIACAVTGGWRHPTAALWPVALRDDLRRALAGGMRRVQDFAARHGIAYAEWPVQPFDPFFNVNTPEDVAAAEALARTQGGERAATGQ
jgi:molybdopterin-guanine dinucleotide biosynthesis protein A